MDIRIPLEIHGVPSKSQAEAICGAISQLMYEKFQTDMWVTYEDVTDDGEQIAELLQGDPWRAR